MKRNLYIFLTLIALCALASVPTAEKCAQSPFSIGGVSLGDNKDDLLARYYSTCRSEGEWALVVSGNEEVLIRFDERNRAKWIMGTTLQLHSVDCSPEAFDAPLPESLKGFLGKPDWTTSQTSLGNIVRDEGFERYHLVVETGCCGWVFFLGDEPARGPIRQAE